MADQKTTPQKNPENGHFLPGNSLWRRRASHGVKPKFERPEDLQEACIQYFAWCEETPIFTAKLAKDGDGQALYRVPRLRAFTIGGLCLFIGVTFKTWALWREERPDLGDVIAWAEEVIREQKFTAAAAGELEPNIIARDLGLADKRELSNPDGTMRPKDPDLSAIPVEALRAVREALAGE